MKTGDSTPLWNMRANEVAGKQMSVPRVFALSQMARPISPPSPAGSRSANEVGTRLSQIGDGERELVVASWGRPGPRQSGGAPIIIPTSATWQAKPLHHPSDVVLRVRRHRLTRSLTRSKEHRMSPIVLHIPHASRKIPEYVRSTFLPDDAATERELLVMTDHLTDEIVGGFRAEVDRVIFGVSRLVVNPERFPDDADEPMAGRGMGATYTHLSSGEPLRGDCLEIGGVIPVLSDRDSCAASRILFPLKMMHHCITARIRPMLI